MSLPFLDRYLNGTEFVGTQDLHDGSTTLDTYGPPRLQVNHRLLMAIG